MSNLDAIELEVQRRLADYLASAGVPQGRISLEVLYMLPPDFIRAYRTLFDRAFLESVSDSGGGDPGRAPERRKNVGVGSKGGKRYRTYWVIRDEQAFQLKGSVDRKLKRLALEMGTRAGKEVKCQSCSSKLQSLQDASGRKLLRFCPYCSHSLG